ncbi:peptidoglycan DD-metalloendopeptidase family protein [Streptomyces sp. NPDC001279]|uniref:peptidoglycan DD-metalloendopeptidase family protein n=1 Tax=Streptomyces sp. NPDC001279 TaxID=3364556 RepID=UPI00369B9747
MPSLDVVGGAAVDVVPVIPQFHSRLKAMVLPIADRVGEEAGERMGRAMSRSLAQNLTVAVPNAITRAGQAGRAAATRAGSDNAGAFATAMKRHLQAAFQAMPKLDIRLSSSGADAELARLRARLEQLSNKRIGIDVDAMAARAEVQRIERELQRLGAEHPNVAVRADTAAARTALAAMRAEIDAVDRRHIDVPVRIDTGQATAALMSLGMQAAALAAIPLGPILAAGLGAVTAMATAAGAGIGATALVAVPAIKGVAEALRLKTAAEDEAAQATDRSAASSSQAANRALQLAGAQAQLASAHRNAAQSAVQANRQVEAAERAVADAAQRAAEQRQAAADGVRRAEQSLTDAKRTARDAEAELTRARQDAAQQLAALNDRLLDGYLDQREAALRVKQAQQELTATLADADAGRATQLQVEAAQLAFDRAQLNAKQTSQSFDELQKSAAKQKRAGVEGSDAVKAATERVRQAQRGVVDQTDALKAAQQAATKASVDGARAVADAQERVADAVRNAANAQASAAESIANAQRGLQRAQLSTADATGVATTKQDDYRKALADMTPAARQLFDSIAGPRGLSAAYKEWHTSLQPHVLPLFTRGIDGAKASLPGLTPIVLAAARGIESLMDSASAEMKEPFWKEFKDDITDSVEPAITGLGKTIGFVLKGAAGVVDAFLPKMDGIADRSTKIGERFANWGTNLKGSPEFERFLQYVKETAPDVAKFLGKILTTAVDVAKAAAPLSTKMMAVVSPVFEAIGALVRDNPEIVQMLWSLWAAQKAIALGMVLFAAAMTTYQSVMLLSSIATMGFGTVLNATGILPIIRAVLLVVGLLVAGFVLAYNKCDWFRNAVDAAWEGIKTATSFVWDNVLKPIFTFLWEIIKKVGEAALWLYEKAIKPAFDFIAAAVKPVVTALLTILLLPAYAAFKALGVIAKWLSEKVIGPVFGWIGEKAKWLYEKAIKPALGEARKVVNELGDAVNWLWSNAVKPVFNWIGDRAKWLYDKAIKPHMADIRKAVDLTAIGFENAKKDIEKSWNQLKDITREPVRFIIERVYNKGIVPLWNGVASITGADKLKPIDIKKFHTGGIMSGYSPGRDDRLIAVGGGEAVMRPEWTRAVGADRINQWNAAARSGGVGGVQRAISSGTPAFADGGIVGWIKDKASDAGKFLSGALDFLDPSKLFDKAKGLAKSTMEPILANPWAKSVAKLPLKMLTDMKDMVTGFFFGGGGTGQWVKPVNAGYGTKFGVAGRMWSSGHHTGLDFPAAVGTAIKAVSGGRVTTAQGGGPYGNHVMINHGGGLSSLYAHMTKILASVGKSVRQGQTIGTVGATGNVTGPHLHLEARVNGRPVDPMSYLTGGGGGGNGGSGVARWRPTVLQALSMTGNPASYADLTLRRMNQESGGNPRAVNNWDSNARAGYPSTGLMQLIRPTWQHYAGQMIKKGPFLNGVSIDPLANIFASMRYAKAAYGSLPSAYNRPGGYDSGGYLMPGWTPVFNGTGKPEPVFTAGQWETLRANARRGSQAPNVTVENHVWVGDRELTDIVDERVVVREEQTAAAINTGRWI